ncbi:hypothetical protein PENSPDRAFT_737460 [Peniophora sp. CONT]|nr:hypothetical protein PENSPDRAFT_737460 [Peniophora sp. CONT]
MAAATTTTDAPQKLSVSRRCTFVVLGLVHAALIYMDTSDMFAKVRNSPASPTDEAMTEWESCSPLGIWSFSGRFLLNACGVIFATVNLVGGVRINKVVFPIFAYTVLAQAAWFMTGPFMFYNYAAECAASAPGILHTALVSYVAFAVCALYVMLLFSIFAYKGIRKAQAQLKAQEAAKAAQVAQIATISEKAPVEVIPGVPEGQLVDVKIEELV